MRSNQYIKRVLTLCLLLSATMAVHAQKENLDTLFDIHHILGYLVAAFLITVFVMIFTNRLIYYKEQQVRNESLQMSAQLALILDSNKTETWTFDVDQNLYKVLSDQGTSETVYAPIDFSQFYDRDDFLELRKVIMSVCAGDDLSGTLLVKSATPKEAEEEQKIYEITVTILRRDRHGLPKVVLGTQRDVTNDQKQAEKTREMMLRFHTVFESSLVDMMYFDANGTMIDINDKACESYFVKDRKALLARKPNIKDFPSLDDIDMETAEETHTSSIVDLSHVEHPIGEMNSNTWGGERAYYERATTIIRDHEGKMTGIVMAFKKYNYA